MLNSTKRFSDRVADYLKYRPRYPEDIIQTLTRFHGLSATSVVADIGSGTGFLSELFLLNGNAVYCVEPNNEMRVAGEGYLREYNKAQSLDGVAENTGLPPDSIDIIAAGQAAHWFDSAKAREEFKRLLRPGGQLVLVWNERRSGTPLAVAYEELLIQFGKDYTQIRRRDLTPAAMLPLYGHNQARLYTFESAQHFDLEGFAGRLLSASYIPKQDEPGFVEMMIALRTMFEQFSEDDKLVLELDTIMFVGELR